jgi:hypothetical protein
MLVLAPGESQSTTIFLTTPTWLVIKIEGGQEMEKIACSIGVE